MIESLETLRDIIELAIEGAECEVDRVTITAGRPSAPVGEDCTAIYIFGDQAFDFNQNDQNACSVRGRWSMDYEIHTCYPEAPDDVTDAQHLTAADCLYELMDLVWCAIVSAKDSGTFGKCEFVELQPLDVQPRQGMSVSALGGVTIPLDC
jgi:hypothetical protein